MVRRVAWPIRNIGRRGVFLVMFGAIYLVFGVSVLSLSSRRFSDISPIVGPLLDDNLWGVMWIACALVAITTGVRRRWDPRTDGMGFGALLIPPAAWTIFYAASVVAYFATNGQFGRANSFSGMAVWSIVWFVILLVSGWPEPRVPPAEPHTDGEE